MWFLFQITNDDPSPTVTVTQLSMTGVGRILIPFSIAMEAIRDYVTKM